MAKTENQVCSDCPERQPRWASLIVPPPGSPAGSIAIGAFSCLECSGSHRRLGVHIAFVRSITLDSWKEKEVLAMENGGNRKVNAIFEANLPSISNKPTLGASGTVRERFIRDKYERRKYYDSKAFAAFGGEESSSESESEEEESPPRRNVVRAPSEAARLRAQARKQSSGGDRGTIARPKSSHGHVRTPVRKKAPVQAPAPATPPVVDLLDFSMPPSSNPGLGPPPNPPSASPSPTLDMFKSFQSASISNVASNVDPSMGRGNVINNVGVGRNGPPAAIHASSNSTQSNDNNLMPQVETKKMTSDDILAMFHVPSPQAQPQPGMMNGFGNFGPSGMNNSSNGMGGNMGNTNQNVSQLMMMNGMAPNSNSNNNMMMMNNAANGMMNMNGSGNGNALNGMQSQGANQMQQFSNMQQQQAGKMRSGNAGTMNSRMHASQQSQMPQHNMQPQFNIAMDPPTSMQAPMGGSSNNLNVMGGGVSEMSNNFANFHQHNEQSIAIATSAGGNKSNPDKNPQMDQFASFASFH